jgi:leucyl aminopeptidase
MKIFVKKGQLRDIKSQAIVLALFQDKKELTDTASLIDQASGGLISEIIKNGDFAGKSSQVAIIYTCGTIPAQKIALVGLGKTSEVNPEKIRAIFSKVIQQLRDINVKKLQLLSIF